MPLRPYGLPEGGFTTKATKSTKFTITKIRIFVAFAIGFASLRQDVPRDHVAEHLISKEGVPYLDSHLERYVNLRNDVVAFLNTVLPR